MRTTKCILMAVVAVALAVATFVGFQFFGRVSVPEDARTLTVAPNETAQSVSARLSDHDLIAGDFWFRALVRLTGAGGKFLAGTVRLPERVSSWELIRLLSSDAMQDVRTITIPEGLSIRDIASYLEQQGMFRKEEFIALVGAPGVFGTPDNDFYSELAVAHRPLVYRTAAAPLEGFLFPDTYEVFADATPRDIVAKMVENFDRKITEEMMDELARQEKNFYKALIMASIIEAEVPHEEDRAIVSGIFWSRLAAGVPLQSDATLKYLIHGSRPALTNEELQIDSAYNTYKYRELPPTPIGNPGLSAIRAAIYPADTDYFYFLSTPEGETIFSRTLEEHNAAKAKYLK